MTQESRVWPGENVSVQLCAVRMIERWKQDGVEIKWPEVNSSEERAERKKPWKGSLKGSLWQAGRSFDGGLRCEERLILKHQMPTEKRPVAGAQVKLRRRRRNPTNTVVTCATLPEACFRLFVPRGLCCSCCAPIPLLPLLRLDQPLLNYSVSPYPLPALLAI